MKWWSAEPVLFTNRDYEGHRLRLIIAEKRAQCATRILDRANPAPEYMSEVNPEGIFPVLIDKHLICYGGSLDELLHERYPGPPLLPSDPIARAQLRMLADRVRSWYSLRPNELADKMAEVASVFPTNHDYFAGAISVVDMALAPLLYDMPEKFIELASDAFLDYRQRLLSRPSFAVSLKSQAPSNELFDDGDDDELSEDIYDNCERVTA